MVIFIIVFSLISGSGLIWAESPVLDEGERLYQKYCLVCHGEKGDGKGQSARLLFPKPRDLTSGIFKVRSTPTGEPPTDNDILTVLKNGMPGSSMPSFVELSDNALSALVNHVKKIGNITEGPAVEIKPGTSPPVTKEVIAKGKELYKDVKCFECHGENGKGDGPKADKLVDNWKQPAPPNAFTMGIYKGGAAPADIYLRFTAGMDGSPMPSYEDSMTNEDRWAVVFYTLSLAGTTVAKQPTSGKIKAEKIKGAILSDPDDNRWKSVDAFRIPLMLLWQNPTSGQRVIDVKTVHNGEEIAFLVEWRDDTKNTSLDLDVFRDGAALQFPSKEAENPPSFWMGDEKGKDDAGMVNIWFWKADLQESIDNSKNPVSKRPVENLMSNSFGTLTLKDEQNVTGKGRWKDGKWSVVFKRAFNAPDEEVKFTEGKSTPFALAVWDGANGDVDGRKAVSTWYYVVPE